MVGSPNTTARLQLRERLDPTSGRAFYDTGDEFGIRSDAANTLLSELQLYLSGDLEGLSFLIAGHRGAGKTTLVWQVGRKLLQIGRNRGRAERPLMVPLNGPRLLPAGPEKAPSQQQKADSPEKDDAAGNESQIEQISNDVDRALLEFAVGLCIQLAKTMARGFRDRIREREHLFSSRELQRRYELAARLELELDLAPRADVLRELWSQGGYLKTGVLFSGDEAERRTDQGMRELVALSTACDVYRRVSGVYTKAEETQTDSANKQSSAEASLDTTGKDIFSPLMALLTGGLVGTGVGVSVGTGAGVITGLIAALGAGSVIKLSTSRSRERSVTRASSYERDLTLNTLDRELPKLVSRIRQCGLAPIFVIDELDKVNLEGRITRLVRDLKTFVAEQATFCFLADRRYYEAMIRKSVLEAYPKEYTYFKRRLFIAHGHRELHDFLVKDDKGRIAMPGAITTDDESQTSYAFPELDQDRAVLPYCLLHQARMHPIDLERSLASLDDGQHGIGLDTGAVRSRYNFRQDLTIQLAIEMLLEHPDVDAQLRVEPEFRRFIHDSLYYPTRCWAERGADSVDLSANGYGVFKQYLRERGGRLDDDTVAQTDDKRTDPLWMSSATEFTDLPDLVLTEGQSKWLWRLVSKLIRMLSDPIEYAEELNQRQQATEPLETTVVDAISIAPPIGPMLVRRGDSEIYDWRRSPSGRRLIDNGRQGLHYDLKLRLACRQATESIAQQFGIDPADANQFYFEIVTILRGMWHRLDPCEYVAPLPENFRTEPDYWKASGIYEACGLLSGTLAMTNVLSFQIPDSLRLAVSDAALLGPMLAPKEGGPESTLGWLVDSKGNPFLEPDQPDGDLQVEFEPESEYAADLAYVQSFKVFIDSLASI